jgi:hypothetical protein
LKIFRKPCKKSTHFAILNVEKAIPYLVKF